MDVETFTELRMAQCGWRLCKKVGRTTDMIFDAEVGEYYCSKDCEEADLESESDEWEDLFADEYEVDAFEQANADMNARLYGEYQERRDG